MNVRPMREADLNAVVRIEQASFSNPWSANAFRYELHSPHARIYIAGNPGASADTIYGYACLHYVADEIHLLKIAIDSNMRRQGIAEYLLVHCIKKADETDKSAVILEVRPSNRAAIHLYRKFGFEIIATRPNYYLSESGKREDAMIMRKQIERR